MVTDEDRDYMYRVYASDPQARINLGIRRRLAPLMGNDRRRIELMNALLFSLPGTPVVYYGDEIGMGDNIYLGDRNGVSTPMQWSPDRNAGFSQANPQKLYSPVIIDPEYHYEALNVDAQQNNPHSLLWWTKHIIGLRRQYRAFGRGTLRFLFPDNARVLAFVREYEDERHPGRRQPVPLRAGGGARSRRHAGGHADRDVRPHAVPADRGRAVHGHPEPVRLLLVPAPGRAPRPRGATPGSSRCRRWPSPAAGRSWCRGDERELLEAVLPTYLRESRWFRGKARQITSVEVVRAIPVPVGRARCWSTLVEVRYLDADAEQLHHPARLRRRRPGARASPVASPGSVILSREGGGVVYDAMADEEFANAMVDGIGRRRHWRAGRGRAGGEPHPRLPRRSGARTSRCAPPCCAASSPTPPSISATGCSSSCSARRSRG